MNTIVLQLADEALDSFIGYLSGYVVALEGVDAGEAGSPCRCSRRGVMAQARGLADGRCGILHALTLPVAPISMFLGATRAEHLGQPSVEKDPAAAADRLTGPQQLCGQHPVIRRSLP